MTPDRIDRGSAWRAAIVLAPLVNLLGILAATVGSARDNPWYDALTLPAWQPPGPLFGIAWTILYTLISVAAALVWAHRRAPGRTAALALWVAQLLLNLCWSPLFFRFHQILPAFLLILVILAVAILATVSFGRISRVAAWLMVPYLVWLAFAAALNVRTWQLNPNAGPAIEEIR